MNHKPRPTELRKKYEYLQGPDRVAYASPIVLIFLIYLVYPRKFFITNEENG